MAYLQPLDQSTLDAIGGQSFRRAAEGFGQSMTNLASVYQQEKKLRAEEKDRVMKQKIMEMEMDNLKVDRALKHQQALGDMYMMAADAYSQPGVNSLAIQTSMQGMLSKLPEEISKNAYIPKNQQEALTAMATANKYSEWLQLRKSKSTEDADSGLYVKPSDTEPGGFEVVGSGSRLKSGDLTSDKPGLAEQAKAGEVYFVRGDSPLAQAFKSGTSAKPDEITKDTMKEINKNYEVALEREPGVQQIESIVTSPEFESGRLDAFLVPFQEWAGSFGFDVPKNTQDLGKLHELLSKEYLLNIGYQKGNLNQKEYEGIIDSVGRTQDIKQKLKTTALVSREVIKRQKLRKEMADNYRAGNKGSLDGFAKVWNEYIEARPMVKKVSKDGAEKTLLFTEAEQQWRKSNLPMEKFYEWWSKQ